MWVDNEDPPPAVTCLLRASSSSILNLFFFFFLFFFFSLGRSSAFQQCRRRCAVISATRMPTTCLAFALRSSHLRLFPDWGLMTDLREGKVWGHLCSVFPLTCPPCMRLPPPSPPSLLQTDNGGHYHHREKQLTSNLRQRPDNCSGVSFLFCFVFLFFSSFSIFFSGIRQRCRRNFMCATLKDTAQTMVALLTAGVRSVTWVFPLYFILFFLYQLLSTLLGGKSPSKWEDTWRIETRRVERKMWIKRSVARR